MSEVASDLGNRQARSYEEIKPVADLCRVGKLFEVQAWIAAGRPVNPPTPSRGNGPQALLDIALDLGFHSMVQVLLQAGAVSPRDGWSSPLNRAVQMRRLDLIQLLVDHGYELASVDMKEVFTSWDPEAMEYFIDRGADVETGNPLAYALCQRIRTALRVLKRYRDRFPTFPEQANIALRHHCKEGNLKWVSLMLWAGADPYAPGADDYDQELDPKDKGICALAYAVLYRHYEIFQLKGIQLDVTHPSMKDVARYADKGEGLKLLEKLLENGLEVNDQHNGGSSFLRSLLDHIGWNFRVDPWDRDRPPGTLDTTEARDKMQAVDLIAKHGGKWVPEDRSEINSARRALLKLKPEYTVEFVAIMAEYGACAKENLQTLLGTQTMKTHTAKHSERILRLLSSLP
jgi:hypothetical protein